MGSPTWFNEKFFQEIINEETNSPSEASVIDFNISPGLTGVNNHCSVIYQSNVQVKRDGKSKRKYFIIKAPLIDGALKEIAEQGKFIEKEFMVYKSFFPIADRLLGNVRLSPKYFPSKESVLVLEDLLAESYIMCDKFQQLDFQHSMMVMKTLATFHAASVAVYKKNPELVSSIGEAYIFDSFNNHGYIFMKDKLLQFGNAVENWKGFERFGNKIREVYETCCDRMYTILNRKSGFNVMNHGDLWTNNILFKYDEKRNVKDVKLIDFQICVYGSFGIDLQFFTWTSVRNDIRSSRMDELYSVYKETFNTTLAQLECEERITDELLKKELEFTMYFGFFSVFCCLNVIFSGEDNADNLTNVFYMSCYKEKAQQILINLENNGFFK